ncbi:MAG: 4-phosphoerythronate dehydrogenase [Bacteroidales bacterium]|nr:4-phosphoerythronate dehydrogenase [Bacteroidales bacterium]
MKIIADHYIPFLKGVLEPKAEVVYANGSDIIASQISDANALLIRTRTFCTPSLLENSKVRFIGTATIGTDHIDKDFCHLNNIEVVSAPGCNSASVAHYVASALFWYAKNQNVDLSRLCIGVIGAGNIGSKVIDFCRALGMNVLVNDPPRARLESEFIMHSIDEICEKADVITFHVPLIKNGNLKTRHLADTAFFSKLKSAQLVINTSRGEVIESSALKSHLNSNPHFNAIIDVWENEPFPDEDLINCCYIATPHIAGYSQDGKANGTAAVVRALSEHFELGLDSWYPENIPFNLNSEITMDAKNSDLINILELFYLYTYPIFEDSERFKSRISDFELLRGNYPIRRDPSYYTLNLLNTGQKLLEVIKKINIRLKNQ